jgi:hypothetical protein
MTGTRGKRIGARAACIAVALGNLLTIASVGCGEKPGIGPALRGRGTLVAPLEAIASCSKAVYRGPETPLYSNRPYHTAERVDAAVGLAFCRGARHGTSLWIVEVSQPTTLLAFGTEAFGLAERGWARSKATLLVFFNDTATTEIYTKRFTPGRYVIRQGFTPTAPVVFWDEEAVRLVR